MDYIYVVRFNIYTYMFRFIFQVKLGFWRCIRMKNLAEGIYGRRNVLGEIKTVNHIDSYRIDIGASTF